MNKQHYHISGICGTAMASLAVLLKKQGHKVTGSDQNIYPPMSDLLAENEIEVVEGYHPANLQPHPDFVVIGNALSRGNPEVEYALEAHLHYVSMAEVLKNDFIRGHRSIVISGTHGKTTTTSLAAHVLTQCGQETGFMIGGVAENFNCSSHEAGKGGYFVVEGDEYDTCFFDKRSKFFHYLPDLLVINNIEFDHADIFSSLEEIKKSFTLMLRQIPKNGLILVNGDDQEALEVARKGFSPIITFGLGEHNQARITKVTAIPNRFGTGFDLSFKNKNYQVEIPLLGEFNARNATAVILLALEENIPFAAIQKALLSFKSVKRRLEQISQTERFLILDDFAHHPTAIFETIRAVKQAWPQRKIHAVYEARSNTSLKRFHQEKMAPSFAAADSVILSKHHRADQLAEDEQLDMELIIKEIIAQGKQACLAKNLDDIIRQLKEWIQVDDIVLIMSQGDFGGLPRLLAAQLEK